MLVIVSPKFNAVRKVEMLQEVQVGVRGLTPEHVQGVEVVFAHELRDRLLATGRR